ncbi:MFS transporter [Fusobacterium sp. MFO224]|uniref:MFS transporter n=1 Tax=Fusobacterium sp. MFO224 TaxID=3378070 RepID=UPI003851DFFD
MMKLDKKTQIFYGMGVSYAIVDQIFAQWILYFYLPPENSGLKIIMPPLFISIALAISRIVDMVTDPVVGYLSDKIDTKWGRRIPFIAFGSVPLGIMTVAFFYPPTGSNSLSFIYLAIVGSLFFTFYTIVGAPYNAIIPEIGNTMEERLNLSTWQSVFRLIYTAVAMILPGVLIKIIGRGDVLLGIRGMVITLSIVASLGGYITVFGVSEKKYSKGKVSKISFKETISTILSYKNFIFYLFGLLFFFVGFNTLRATMNYYVEDIMGYGKTQITIASALLFGMSAIFFYPTNKISKKIGYRKIMLFDLLLLVIFTGMLLSLGKLIPKSFGFIIFALIGIPVAGGAFIFPPAMLSEISNKIKEETGNKIEGICFGIQGFFLKMAFMISILLLPFILVFGSSSGMVNKNGIYMTALFAIVAFIISFVFYYKYEE